MKLVNGLWNSPEVSKYLSAGLEHPVSVQLTYNRMNVKWRVNLIGINFSHVIFVTFFKCNFCHDQVVVSNHLYARGNFSIIYIFVAKTLQGLQTYSKLDANIQGFSENAQGCCAKIAAG